MKEQNKCGKCGQTTTYKPLVFDWRDLFCLACAKKQVAEIHRLNDLAEELAEAIAVTENQLDKNA